MWYYALKHKKGVFLPKKSIPIYNVCVRVEQKMGFFHREKQTQKEKIWT
jgi:hypothetical protein